MGGSTMMAMAAHTPLLVMNPPPIQLQHGPWASRYKYAKAYMSELSTRYPTLQGTCCNKTSKGRINLQRFLIVHTHLASTRVEGGD